MEVSFRILLSRSSKTYKGLKKTESQRDGISAVENQTDKIGILIELLRKGYKKVNSLKSLMLY